MAASASPPNNAKGASVLLEATFTLSTAQQKALLALVPSLDRYTQGLQVYIVGGAVRDALLGQRAGDRDWVVVGASPEVMVQRGFIPVGGDFPVFLHPKSKEEYALARTERKSGRGYKGFTFYTGTDVSLEEDLQRRDLTINAMALGQQGELVDPLNGFADLQQRVLRHVGVAFVEDPVRLLRLARFAARFPEFSIAPDTMQLAQQLVAEGEVDALVPERVWQELLKALHTRAPQRFIAILQQVGAQQRVLPELHYDEVVAAALQVATAAVPNQYLRATASVDQTAIKAALLQLSLEDAEAVHGLWAAHTGLSVAQRYAVLCAQTAQNEALSARIRAINEAKDLARLSYLLLHEGLLQAHTAADQLQCLERLDALRRPERFLQLLACVLCYQPIDGVAWLWRLVCVKAVDAGAIARSSGVKGAAIKDAVRTARIAALAALAAS